MARFLNDIWAQIQNQRERWIFWTPVPVALGIIFYFSLHAEPPLLLGSLVFIMMSPLLRASYRNYPVFLVVLAVFLAVGGFTAAQWRTHTVSAPVLEKKTYAVTLRGKVVEVEPQPKTHRIVLEGVSVVKGNIWQDTLPRRVRVRLKNNDPAKPQAGDVVELRAVLLPLSSPVLPGAFDFQRHAFYNGLGGTGYAIGTLNVLTPRASGEFFFEKLRRIMRDKIAAAIPDRDNAAMMTAFMIGEDKGISEKDWEIARQSGIAHLIAISGSHFILIAGFPFFFVRALLAAIPYVALRWPVKKIAAVVAVLVSVFYMLLIGSPIPAQRAVIMTCVVMTAVIFDRNPFTLRLAVFAALILFMLEPESVMGPSFQMSFAAVVGLIAFYEATADWWKKHFRDADWSKRYSLYLLACFSTSLVASLATAPFALYHFSRMPLLGGLAANMVAVPISSFVTFPAGLFACLLMPFGLEKWPLVAAEKSLDVFMYVAEVVAAWPYAGYETNAWPGWVLGIMTLGGLWVFIWRGYIRWLGLAPVAAGVVLMALIARPDVLVAASGDLFAVRAPDGKLWFSSLSSEKFVREQWLKREGHTTDGFDVWPKAHLAGGQGDFLSCDDEVCVYRLRERTVAFIRAPDAIEKHCQTADILVAKAAIKLPPNCRKKTTVIDRWALRDNGAHIVYIAPDALRVVNVRDTRGTRPWTGRDRRRDAYKKP